MGGAALVVLLAAGVNVPLAAQSARAPQAGEVRLDVQVCPAGGLGVTCEPVVIVSRVTNLTEASILAATTTPLVQLTVRDEAGREWVPPPAPPADDHVPGRSVPLLELKPRETSRPYLSLVDRFYHFTAPGKYVVQGTVRTCDLGEARGASDGPVIARRAVEYTTREATVAEYEWLASMLAWRSAPLLTLQGLPDTIKPSPLWDAPETSYQMRELAPETLCSLRRDEALPYLAQFAVADGVPWAFDGLRRLGTPAAREVLEVLATSRSAETAAGAAAALKAWDADAVSDR